MIFFLFPSTIFLAFQKFRIESNCLKKYCIRTKRKTKALEKQTNKQTTNKQTADRTKNIKKTNKTNKTANSKTRQIVKSRIFF